MKILDIASYRREVRAIRELSTYMSVGFISVVLHSHSYYENIRKEEILREDNIIPNLFQWELRKEVIWKKFHASKNWEEFLKRL